MAPPNPIWSRAINSTTMDQRRRILPCGSAERRSRTVSASSKARKTNASSPVGPVQRCQRSGRRQDGAITKRDSEAEQAGMEIGNLGAEENHHESECRHAQYQTVCAVA